MKKLFLVLVTLVMLLSAGSVMALTDTDNHDVDIQIPEIVLIALNDATTLTLAISAPSAGADPIGASDTTSKKLFYTSLVPSGLRTVTAELDVAAPAGTALLLEATSVPVGCGTPNGQQTLATGPLALVTAIGSCATGTGAGVPLTYTLNITDNTQLVVGTYTVNVLFTLTDAL